MFVIFQLARGGQVARAVKKQLQVIEASEANRKEDDDSSLVKSITTPLTNSIRWILMTHLCRSVG